MRRGPKLTLIEFSSGVMCPQSLLNSYLSNTCENRFYLSCRISIREEKIIKTRNI